MAMVFSVARTEETEISLAAGGLLIRKRNHALASRWYDTSKTYFIQCRPIHTFIF